MLVDVHVDVSSEPAVAWTIAGCGPLTSDTVVPLEIERATLPVEFVPWIYPHNCTSFAATALSDVPSDVGTDAVAVDEYVPG
jgi:hypothetical protein